MEKSSRRGKGRKENRRRRKRKRERERRNPESGRSEFCGWEDSCPQCTKP